MPLFQARELLQLPTGNNATDTLVNGVHFNRTALNYWNYTLYSNGTLSNGSSCWLTFDEYKPSLLLNGTFFNATSCYSPIEPMRGRGILGLVFGTVFGLSIIFTLKNLRKHGRLYLADEKRWTAVGRRWQWYWMLFIAACGIISAMTGVDVDRDFLQSTPIILQSFFYYLMLPGILAAVWESVRHWGSWQERQICEGDPFSLPQNDTRSRTEFYLPLVFYAFDWLFFFMTIPRSWTAIEQQHSPSQIQNVARPSALDARFKVGAIFALAAWTVTCYSFRHSLRHYRSKVHMLLEPVVNVNNSVAKPVFGITIVAVAVGYIVASTWIWSISPLNATVSNGWLFGLGYAPALLIILVYNIFGLINSNDDQATMMQRQHRERSADHELGIDRTTMKPSWWSKMHGDRHAGLSVEERLRQLTSEIGGVPTASKDFVDALEMKHLAKEMSTDETRIHDIGSTGPGRSSPTYFVRGSTMLEPDSIALERTPKGSVTGESEASSTRSLQAKPQVVRSMLDV